MLLVIGEHQTLVWPSPLDYSHFRHSFPATAALPAHQPAHVTTPHRVWFKLHSGIRPRRESRRIITLAWSKPRRYRCRRTSSHVPLLDDTILLSTPCGLVVRDAICFITHPSIYRTFRPKRTIRVIGTGTRPGTKAFCSFFWCGNRSPAGQTCTNAPSLREDTGHGILGYYFYSAILE
ncbi:hypothetical protein FIBSPDRAFT_230000 [Athelia psychrophila]|uniref:Uncharacterized protein n=1 Tax=Athelia psychrophila TaxID=1759441 RepID=A0A165YPL5_9AGAM|nr:hypothetical protein FIBSPDRAFT_230000 [Fibularhizoctonia sp. CBS 109695]